MKGLFSTTAISSIRPPMLAGPIPRQTKRRSIGSVDQLIGVGVGVAEGVATADEVGAGVCDVDGVCCEFGFSARAAKAPSVIIMRAKAASANTNRATLPLERHASFIRRDPFTV